MNPPPEVVVFDLGKVLLDFDYGNAVRKLLPRCTASPAALLEIIDQSPLLFDLETGRITPERFFAALQAGSGFQGDRAEFVAAFSDVFTPIPPMINLHAGLRARGVPTYIFSNTNAIQIPHIRRQFPFFAEFNGYILSYEHRAMKPDPRLYEVVERVTGRTGASLLYLDDREENVAAGARRGWQAIHHISPENSIASVRASGLLSRRTT
jgi:HAD superfamily hydrolase (TIGR01509 family)